MDQSNKVESSGDTILALANDRCYTVRIPSREKRIVMDYLTIRRLNLIWREEPGFDAARVMFDRVGKKSSAHRRQRKADKTLTADDLLRQIIG